MLWDFAEHRYALVLLRVLYVVVVVGAGSYLISRAFVNNHEQVVQERRGLYSLGAAVATTSGKEQAKKVVHAHIVVACSSGGRRVSGGSSTSLAKDFLNVSKEIKLWYLLHRRLLISKLISSQGYNKFRINSFGFFIFFLAWHTIMATIPSGA